MLLQGYSWEDSIASLKTLVKEVWILSMSLSYPYTSNATCPFSERMPLVIDPMFTYNGKIAFFYHAYRKHWKLLSNLRYLQEQSLTWRPISIAKCLSLLCNESFAKVSWFDNLCGDVLIGNIKMEKSVKTYHANWYRDWSVPCTGSWYQKSVVSKYIVQTFL